MNKVILLRYGELHLKGKNRGFFEKLLIKNIEEKLAGYSCTLDIYRGRYIIHNLNEQFISDITRELTKVFGLYSLSIGYETDSNEDNILQAVEKFVYPGTFKIETHRADKNYPLTSVEISALMGEKLLDKYDNIKVDIHNPEHIIYIDIRENGKTYVFCDKIKCAGGMPVGSAGKGLLLLSGGIDSPVAGYMMAKRGLKLDALHFFSFPYTSEAAKQKVIQLANELKPYCGAINLIMVPFTEMQESIHKYCHSNYMITLLRRAMLRIAEKTAIIRDCGCIVNGESLGQVASQTLESINVTQSVIKRLPIFRPLIGMDKEEIVKISESIGTYQTSILPYEDCCTVFLPDNPVTKPRIEYAEAEEAKIPDYEDILERALSNIQIIKI